MKAVKMSDDLQKKLDNLAGKSWMYVGRIVHVRAINRADGQIRIINDGNTIFFDEEDAKERIEDFLPVSNGPGLQRSDESQAMKVYENDSGQIENLEKLVMENIKKINENPDFLPQAKAITNNVNTMINMSKLKIEMLKEIRKYKD